MCRDLVRKSFRIAEDLKATLQSRDLDDRFKIGYCSARVGELIELLRLVLGDDGGTGKVHVKPSPYAHPRTAPEDSFS